MAPSFSTTLSRAKSGKLSFKQFSDYYLTRSFQVSETVVMNEVSQILVAVERTEPSQEWVKEKWVTVTPKGVSVTTQIKGGVPSLIGGAAEGSDAAISAATNAFNWLQNSIVRIGEIVVGVVIVGVAVNAMMKGRR